MKKESPKAFFLLPRNRTETIPNSVLNTCSKCHNHAAVTGIYRTDAAGTDHLNLGKGQLFKQEVAHIHRPVGAVAVRNHQGAAFNAVLFGLFRRRIRQSGQSLLYAQRLAHFSDGTGRSAFHHQLNMQRTGNQRLHFA